MPKGQLRVYLGAAPGVGKTYAMLTEGARRAARGTSVVVGYVETHGRPQTEAQVLGLDVIPRRRVDYRGAVLEEMDTDAVIAAHPTVALVDELAHTNAPGSRNDKRWQDIAQLLEAGITVITTVNIQHLESLGDVVESITGVRQRETIPDAVLRAADQVQLVDMTPEALRRRMAHGNIYAPDKVDAALSHFFRVGNLTALRELALLWLADRVDEKLEQYRSAQGISTVWPTRDRTVVALTGGPEGATLLRRGARLAAKGAGGELKALYVARSDGLSGASPAALTQLRQLTESLGGTFQIVTGDDVAAAILQYAQSINAARIVLGQSRHRPVASLLRRSVSDAVIDGSGDIDVNVVTHERAVSQRRRGLPRLDRSDSALLGTRRTIAGWVLALAGPPALTAVLANTRDYHSFATELMLYLMLTVAVALVGGIRPAVPAALLGSVLLNYYFAPPLYTFTVSSGENVFAVVMFVLTAIAVASVVSLAARQTARAARARAEADVLSGLADTLLAADREGQAVLPALLDQAVATFSLRGASLLRREAPSDPWTVVAAEGDAPSTPEEATDSSLIGDTVALAVNGPPLSASEHGLLVAFAAHAAARLDREALSAAASRARALAEGNRARTALLSAVSHDLRTPLAGIKAAVTSLRSDDVEWSEEDEAELLETIEESADRLDSLVGNLLDMSRLESDSLTLLTREVGIEEVLPAIWTALPDADLSFEFADDAPTAYADPGLLERVLANLVENAVRHSDGKPVTVGVSGVHTPDTGDRLQVHVRDHGPGVPEAQREAMFAPFQRMGDAPAGNGVGLGLAVARGLTEAMGGTLTAEDTPGGGLTMIVDLPAAQPVSPEPKEMS
ncbi:histidine kinase OS=Tsukamurella paurometabola (strain ATCC 8368 / DSM / CCUG 35730 / CIP 100753/ JCM 10117 / KCTC 9821 / NBRC 16120 / NCIMB 702349 / NCTC 13040) OX=521096 GN=Tpau_3247 PE=4 SV=1 [Tsukamurella paurometabola]|uniref:histidine kinase n=1 Tax=Tsukamurella paurometabola (strain ATCC 8368 / DSM 20162 / CCUG 35730 / CIP 100753 / JCM 10117 / KCTC 9821 / NBRC 16120 / NCIMB 702349 / NCTC 13040) TaxID=521096 RepID=D5UVQ0_TSUPD|nr:ATP-binding protein [Tsukamurella paurometabola]ADG79832.1 Osmosensitive K channel His kinase sensor [Tsukamurella paurometabola DSM 20162]SUP37369.1 Sensor protein KdpD [Tsukamurella paurometabola]